MPVAFDPMAIAVDWLDAYRAAKLETILNLYDDQARLECDCDGEQLLVGKAALEQYWIRRFVDKPALELDDLQPEGDGVALAYHTRQGPIRTVLAFNALGKIERTRCEPIAGNRYTPAP